MIRDKATEIANEVLKKTGNGGEAIATGLEQARIHFKKEKESNYDHDRRRVPRKIQTFTSSRAL